MSRRRPLLLALGLLLMLGAAPLRAQSLPTDPLDPVLLKVGELCFQGSVAACWGLADSVQSAAHKRVFYGHMAQIVRRDPAQADAAGVTVEQVADAAGRGQNLHRAELAAGCAAVNGDWTSDGPLAPDAVQACQPLIHALTLGCWSGVGQDCRDLSLHAAAGRGWGPASPGTALGYAADACALGEDSACSPFRRKPPPAPLTGDDDRYLVLAHQGIDASLPELERLFAVAAADDSAPPELVAVWNALAEPLARAHAAGASPALSEPLLAVTYARCTDGVEVACKLLHDARIRQAEGQPFDGESVLWIQSACDEARDPILGEQKLSPPFRSCKLADSMLERGRLTPHRLGTAFETANETARQTTIAMAQKVRSQRSHPSSGSSTSSSSSSGTSTSAPSTSGSSTPASASAASRRGPGAIAGYFGVGGIRSWTLDQQASSMKVGFRPSVGPVAFDLEWDWMSDRRWKGANKTWERNAFIGRVHVGIPLLSGLTLRLGGGGQLGEWAGRASEAKVRGGGPGEVLELCWRPRLGRGSVLVAVRIEQHQWFGAVRGQDVQHLSIVSLVLGGGT